jgi:hypothetical protein
LGIHLTKSNFLGKKNRKECHTLYNPKKNYHYNLSKKYHNFHKYFQYKIGKFLKGIHLHNMNYCIKKWCSSRINIHSINFQNKFDNRSCNLHNFLLFLKKFILDMILDNKFNIRLINNLPNSLENIQDKNLISYQNSKKKDNLGCKYSRTKSSHQSKINTNS